MIFRWYSPFPLPASVVEELVAVGGIRWDPPPSGHQESGPPLLLLYPAPHGALSPPAALLAGYRELLERAPSGHLCHLERLQGHPPARWPDLAQGTLPPPSPEDGAALTTPEPLRCLVTLALVRERPAVLDAYLDLELAGDLGGSAPDSDYQERLRRAIPLDALVAALEDGRPAQDLAQARQEAEALRQQLQQAYEELEHRRGTAAVPGAP
jgi:hypothetical protein